MQQTNKFLIVMSAKSENNVKMLYFINGKRVSKDKFKICNIFSENQRNRQEIEINHLTKLSWIADIKF